MTQKPPAPDRSLQRQKRLLGIAALVFVLAVLVLLTILVGGPLLSAVRNGTTFRQWMASRGFLKYPLMVGLVALQVVIAFIPGEPIEFAAGYIFGAWLGSLLCAVGFTLGSLLVVLTVRKFGMKLLGLIFSDRDIQNVRLFRNPKTRDFTIFLMFLIPGTPKDVFAYLAGLVPIHLGRYLLISGVARLPSLLTSTLAGSWAEQDKFTLTLVIYGATLLLTVAGVVVYRAWEKREKASAEAAEKGSDVQAG